MPLQRTPQEGERDELVQIETSSITIGQKQLRIDGVPRIVMAGEVHYFRLARDTWEDRLDKLVESGCDTVASYIPWLWHELPDGTIDLTGATRAERDLGAFIDLCTARGLGFIARPGPFVMAELKNEGLPFRLYSEHPSIVPVTWDGVCAPTKTVDYLAPAFLTETARWYSAVAEILRPRLGTVIAFQLDNEIGMLSWVSRSPDLTPLVLSDFTAWLISSYGKKPASKRYGFPIGDPDHPASDDRSASLSNDRSASSSQADGRTTPSSEPPWFDRFRTPSEGYALPLMRDLGYFMRERFARYVRELRTFATDSGLGALPFLVNVHGTSDGRGATFPIGISQLATAYSGIAGLVAGSDHYLGDLTTSNAIDLYLINAFLDAVNDADQPLTSIEFEAGDGDYGSDLSHLTDPSAIDLKTRLSIAQGNRLINYYLFTGGINGPLDEPVGDGNDRISFTGERHGTGAPVGPEGQYGLTFRRTADVVHTVGAVAGKLAAMDEEHDRVVLSYLPDYFMTESIHPSSARMNDLVADLEHYRFGGPGQLVARAMSFAGYRFGAIDLQNSAPDLTKVLVLTSAHHLSADLQRSVADFLNAGGKVLLCGAVPTHDMEGAPCTILRDALGLSPHGERTGDHRFFLSVAAGGRVAPRPEVRVGRAQLFSHPSAVPFLTDVDSGHGCGFDIPVGSGRAIVLTADYPGADVEFYRSLLTALGADAGLRHDSPGARLMITSTANADHERFVHALNLTGYDADFGLRLDGSSLFDGNRVHLAGRTGLMLPLGLRFDGCVLDYATTEIVRISDAGLTFRGSTAPVVVAVRTTRSLQVPAGATVSGDSGGAGDSDGDRRRVEVSGSADFTISWS